MAQMLHVDANKVVSVLKEQLSEAHMQNAILQVALADAQEKAADLMKEIAMDRAKEGNPPEDDSTNEQEE
jgi:hypothetical protein